MKLQCWRSWLYWFPNILQENYFLVSDHFMHFQGFMTVVAGKCLHSDSGMSKSYLIFFLYCQHEFLVIYCSSAEFVCKSSSQYTVPTSWFKIKTLLLIKYILKHICFHSVIWLVISLLLFSFAANTEFIMLWWEFVWCAKFHWALHKEGAQQYSRYPLSATVLHLNIFSQKWKACQPTLKDKMLWVWGKTEVVSTNLSLRRALFVAQLNISMTWTNHPEINSHILVCYQFKGEVFVEEGI